MSRLVVIATGGTIATSADTDGVLRPTRTGTDLLTLAGGGFRAEVHDVLARDSSELTPVEWDVIGAAVGRAAAEGADGIVVTHGTDTLEETALWLELTYSGAPPVVLTGAMRGADDPDTDGPSNLRDALTLASRPETRNKGVLVSFGGRTLTPWGLHKTGTAPYFSGAEWDGRGAKRQRLAGVSAAAAPRVDIVTTYPGGDAVAIDACVAAGARGIVLEALGVGNAGPAVVEAVARHCRDGVTVAISSRVPGGAVYPGYGSGRSMVDAGAIPVPGLGAPQARVLTMAALAAGLPVGDVVAASVDQTEHQSPPRPST